MTHVIACIDGSASAPAVCDYAAWASLRLEAPLTFLHVLDQRQYPVAADLSGISALAAVSICSMSSLRWTSNAASWPSNKGGSCLRPRKSAP